MATKRERPFPTQARAVVVGGGIAGCSTAYHLAKQGFGEVVLLERHTLTSGSTFHAAGLVGQLRSSASITRLLGQSVALYESLEAETGQATGWKRCGGLRLACNRERMTELERQATTARSFGLEMHLLTPGEAKALWPLMETGDLVGAAFLPTDGSASPADIANALARGARMHGAALFERCGVTGVTVEGGRVAGVETERGRIACEVIVNCAGRWAGELGALAGVTVPVVSVEHQFLISEPIDGVTSELPTLRDPDRLTYYKEEVGGLVMGGYEPDPVPCDPYDERPGELLAPDFDHFQQLADLAVGRIPALEHAGIRQLVNGAEAFTPDGSFILGEAPELPGFFVAAGFNAYGIAAGGGAGKALAEWIEGGEAPEDLWPVDIRRFGAPHRDARWVANRTLELYGKHYTIAWPHEEHDSGRPLRRSPLYDHLAAAGACFGEKLGWERPNWFAPKGTEARDHYTFERGNWFTAVAEEHAAARERVALFDQTSFAKFEIRGRDAARALDWVCAGDVRKPPGSLTYTQLLNARGGIECDLTVARLASDHFYLVTGTGFATHDHHWISSQLDPDSSQLDPGWDVALEDVTERFGVLALMGPRSREVLTAVAAEDVSNATFPYLSQQTLTVAGHRVRALRVTYVGELGWELHVPLDGTVDCYVALMQAGADHGIANAGYRAIESLRLEKGYRAWGSDLTADRTPLEAGLAWATKIDGDVPFLGRKALEAQRRDGVGRRLAGFQVDDPDVVLLGRETIFRNGERVGWLTSGGFGHSLGASLGLGYVAAAPATPRALREGLYELEVATRRVPAAIHFRAPYDPESKRPRT
ncbi:MAG: GcvT family protein [Deltaproteobacteria bacterium]|nr:GcvT family protein [Deltaproteobacteria bacterium]